MFQGKWILSPRVLTVVMTVLIFATAGHAQNVNYSLGFVPTPSTYSWSGTNSTVITVKNNGSTTIPSGTTIYVENRMRTLVAGRTLAAVQTPPIVGSKVTLIPGSCVAFSYLSGSYASYGCRMTLNSNFLPNETFDAQFSFTLSPAGSPLIPGGPNNQLHDCGTGWLTTGAPWPGAFSGVTIQLPGWTFLNAYGGHGEVGCGVGAPPARDVSIRKLGGGSVPAGSFVNFTLNAQNNGPGTVNSVTVSDTLAAGLTSVVITAGLNWNCAQSAPNVTPQSFTCTYVGPPVGPGAAFLGPIGIQATAQTAGSFQNCASIALVGGVDTNLANNTFCQPYVVTAAPPAKDVTIRKFGGGDVAAGSQVSFLLLAWNNGPASVATGSVTVTDTLPSNLTNITFTGTDLTRWSCSVTGQTLSCTYIGPAVGLPTWSSWFANWLPFIFVQATAQSAGSLKNCADIAFASGVDSNPQDNQGCVDVTVTGVASKNDVSIRKLGGGTVTVGGQVTFTLYPHNNGPGSVSSVTVTDTLPAGATPISAGGWSCPIVSGSQSVTCTYSGSAIGPGQPFPPITIVATAQTAGEFSNCATITLPGDPNAANDTDCRPYIVTNASPTVDIGLKKIGGGTVAAGGVVNFTLQPLNNGPDAAGPGSFTITDNIVPGGLTSPTVVGVNSSLWSPCGFTGSTLTCTYIGPPVTAGYLPPIGIQATAQTAGEFSNCASIALTGLNGATDPDAGNNSDCRPYTVTPALTIACAAALTGTTGVPYSSTVVASGGTLPYAFSLVGTLPPGLNFDASTGLISGTPTQAGTFNFSVQATDATGSTGTTSTTSSCGITIAAPPTGSITIVKAVSGSNDPQTFSFTTTGTGLAEPCTGGVGCNNGFNNGFDLNPNPNITTSKTFSNLLQGAYSVTEIAVSGWTLTGVSCTGTVPNVTLPTVNVTLLPGDNVTCTFTNVKTPVVTMTAVCAPATTGQVGVPYSSAIVATGGAAPYTYTIGSGPLPPGLTLNATTGVISGIPTTAGSFPYTVTVTDSSGGVAGGGLSATTSGCRIMISPAPMAAVCAPATAGQVGAPYSSAIVATGGTAPYTYSIGSGPLPPGLTLNATTGVISGTPTAPGAYPYTVTVTDSSGGAAGAGASATTSSCGITIAPPPSCDDGDANTVDSYENGVCVHTPLLGSLTIVKVAQPNDSQVFHFATTGLPGTGFDLDDDGNNSNTHSNSITFNNLASGVPYTVIEDAVSGWNLGSIGWVVSPMGATLTSNDGAQRKATVTIAGGADVIVTFTNLKASCATPGYVSQGGLCWMPVAPSAVTWQTADNSCSGAIDGLTGWRLPTQAELQALFTSSAMNGQGWALDWTWSSTFNGANHNAVHLLTGVTTAGSGVPGGPDSSSLYFSCVRP